MRLILVGHENSYQLQALLAAFFPFAPLTTHHLPTFLPDADPQPTLVATLDSEVRKATVCWLENGSFLSNEEILPNCRKETLNMAFARLAYPLLQQATGFSLPYGLYTGIRPTKNARNWMLNGLDEAACRRRFSEEFFLSPEKIDLVLATLKTQTPILNQTKKNSYALFVFIPFCPTKCKYCSFISKAIGDHPEQEIDPYLDLLCEELKVTHEAARQAGLTLDTVYIGGGTPSVLSASQLTRLLSEIDRIFAPRGLEYTLEAGRPDTLNEEKLRIMKAHGVNRISINPQTFNHETLKAIGRSHTPLDVLKAYEWARKVGFSSINMDFIAALPGETGEDLLSSLRTAVSLAPENITLHTLTVKRAADYRADALYDSEADRSRRLSAMDMVAKGEAFLFESNYLPYYLYRQKNTVGCLENTGWTKEGHSCAYNVRIMEEDQTILACGANASTKLLAEGGRLLRIFNPKLPYDYRREHSAILEKKRKIPSLLQNTPMGHIPGVPDLHNQET